jgi:hypothetical protein
MFWNKKKKLIQQLEASWGKTKDAEYQFDCIEYFFRNKEKISALQIIPDRTINDIDFYKLFSFVDRTYSRIGQQYLFSKLLIIEKTPDFNEQEKFSTH